MLPAIGSAGTAPAMSSAGSASPVVEGASENNVQPVAADRSEARKTVTFRREDEIQLLLAIAESSAEGASLQAISTAACASEGSRMYNKPLSAYERHKWHNKIRTDGLGKLCCAFQRSLARRFAVPFAARRQLGRTSVQHSRERSEKHNVASGFLPACVGNLGVGAKLLGFFFEIQRERERERER